MPSLCSRPTATTAAVRSSLERRRAGSVAVVIVGAVVAACSGGGASRGERCDTVADCADDLQCLDHICKPECKAAIECGDGSICQSGSCVVIHSELHDPCEAELDCGPGQTCRLPPGLASSAGFCEEEGLAGPPGASCSTDADCRAGTCALGRCTELCARADQCRVRYECAAIPRITPDALTLLGSFRGCLPALGTVSFEIPIDPTVAAAQLKIPVPSTAKSMALVAETGGNQLIGATHVWRPNGMPVYELPATLAQYYANKLRHQPLTGVSVLAIKTTSAVPLEAGAYTVEVGTFSSGGQPSTASRRVRVVEKLGNGASLDVHFYFLDLDDHPCGDKVDALSAVNAPTDAGFQLEYLDELKSIFRTDIALGEITYTDLGNHPELDGLDTRRAGDLFALTTATTGISVFFVRSLSPAGLEVAIGGTPGAPLPGTRASGVAVAASALCYESWRTLARQTAHAMARHMGLYRNREPDGAGDPLDDTDGDDLNLMYWGEAGGTALTADQREILRNSAVLR